MQPYILIAFLLSVTFYCNKAEETPPIEFPPLTVQASPNPSEIGQRVTLYLAAKDLEDNDSLECLWSASGGDFENRVVNGVRVFWSANEAGNYSITCTAFYRGKSDSTNLNLSVIDNQD